MQPLIDFLFQPQPDSAFFVVTKKVQICEKNIWTPISSCLSWNKKTILDRQEALDTEVGIAIEGQQHLPLFLT